MNYLKNKTSNVLKFIGFILIYQFSAAFFLLMKPSDSKITLLKLFLWGLAATAFTLAFTIWRYRKQLQHRNSFHFASRRIDKSSIIEMIILIAVMMGIQFIWQWTIDAKLIAEPDNQKAVNQSLKQMFVINYLYAGVLAPIFEEYIFRGLFFNYFFKLTQGRWSKICGILVCGFVFGFLHTLSFDVNWLFYSALGWVLSFTYLHFKDLKYSIAIHMFNNLI